jgi:hypothetical protein
MIKISIPQFALMFRNLAEAKHPGAAQKENG